MNQYPLTHRAVHCLLCALVFIVVSVSSASAARHKLQVNDPALGEQIRAKGGRLVADYGSYQVYETDRAMPEFEGKHGVENRDRFNHIELNAGDMDTSKPEVAALRKAVGQFTGKRMHLVQFAGPVEPTWFNALQKTGVKIVDYIPNNTYIVYGDMAALSRLQAWVAVSPFVQWDAAYQKDHKIHPRARDAHGRKRAITNDLFAIQLEDDPQANAETLALIDALKLQPIRKQSRALHFKNVIVSLNPDTLDQIASQPDVVSIQSYAIPQKLCERQAQISAGNLTGNVPTGPGYLAWLASKGFTQAQFSASGFAVDVTDSGVDNGTTSPNHFGLYVSGLRPGTARVVYARLEGSPSAGSTIQGCDGHGNLNAHIIAGYNDLSGFPHADTNGFHYGLGICPFVRVGSSVIFDPSSFTDPDYEDLAARAYADGARLSSNSWGENPGSGAYGSDSQRYDALVRDAQPASSAVPAAGNQEMVFIFAAGNDGSGANTIGFPGTAKNVITVGAGENVQAFGGSDGSGISDSGANSANDIISFSSRGPCDDGRIKPDICAPGTHVSGGVAQSSSPGSNGTANACFDGSGVSGGVGSDFYPPGQQFFSASSGTSHSTPGVAGGCALIRQYFINNFTNPPSPAMTKAFLMNAARYMTGTGANDTLYSNNQGMGAMNLGMAFDGVARVLRDQLASDTFTNTGATRVFSGIVSDTNQPFRVTIAWTDAPGATSGNAYKNDLDLTVTVGGNTYKGNVFSGANSVTGGSADPRNNAESVFLPAGVSGPFTITITAANINSDGVPNSGGSLDQDFALVVYNGAQVSLPVIAAAGSTLTAESCIATNDAIDPNETVTVSFSLKNAGTANASNVVVTLLPSGGVTLPSGPQTYGLLDTNGAVVTQPFTFTANGTCGSNITATLQLQDGTNSLGNVPFVFTLGALGPTVTNSFSSGGITALIPDLSSVEVPISVAMTAVIADVNVRVRLNHSYDADLVIDLVHPDGTIVNLASNRGGSSDNYGSGAASCAGTFTIFDDSAATAISAGSAPFAGTFSPEQLLSTLTSKPTQGTWKLRVTDTAAIDTGFVYCVQLDIASQSPVCCGAPSNFPPVISAATVVPSPNAFSDESLVVAGVITNDAESEAITLAYQWQFTTNGTVYLDQATATNATLSAAPSNSGNLWRCRLTPSDASGTGTNFFAGPVAVNHRPNMLGRHGQLYSYDSDLFLASTGGGGTFTRSALINEFSQGANGSKEWMEILFLKDSDARGWTLRDSSTGTITFQSTALWSNVAAGTLLVVYNNGDRDTSLPSDDANPSDGRLVLPYTNSNFSASVWISLNNGGDALALRDSTATLIDGISYGSNSSQTPQLGSVGSGTSANYTNNTEAGVDVAANWSIVSASSATPALGNDTVNSNFVAQLRSGAFNQTPLFRFGASGDTVPGLSIDGTNGLVSGILNAPTGGFYNVVIERFAGTNLVLQQYSLLVGSSNDIYTIPAGKTWAMNDNYTIPGTLIVQGLLDTAGRTLTVSNLLDVTGGTVSNSGTIVYHRLNGTLSGNSQQFNSLPVISAASISPATPLDTDDLVANITSASDVDNDPITFTYQWQESSSNAAFNNIAFTLSTLTNTATTAGQYYRVIVAPNDGIADGAPFTTPSVQIALELNLQILSIQISGSNVEIIYSAVASNAYELQTLTDLALSNWSGIATNTPAATGPDQFIDTGAASWTNRFYRIKLLP